MAGPRNPAFGLFFLVAAFLLNPTLTPAAAPETNNNNAIKIQRLANPAIALDATITAAPDPSLVNLRLQPRQTGSSAPHGRDACSALYSVYSWCSTSGYTNLAGVSALASCACYYNKEYVPRIFDGLATSCYDYIRSVRPEATAGVAQYLNVCYLAGDISKSATQGSLACNSLAAVLTSCAGRTAEPSGYVFSGSSSLAGCACYTSRTSFAPDRFNHLASACYTYAQNLAGQGGQISTLLDFCDSVGDVRQSASRALQSCQMFENQYNSCQSGYIGDFATLTGSLQASCLCYGARTTWVPGAIDGAVETCLGYVSSADPQRARSIAAYAGGFCEGFGDLRVSTSTSEDLESTTTIRQPTLPPSTIAVTTTRNATTTTSYSPTAVPTESQASETRLPTPTGTGIGGSTGSRLDLPSLQVIVILLLSTVAFPAMGL